MFDISIAIPTYDRGEKGVEWLRELFESLKKQTFRNFDIWVSDQSKTDINLGVCLEYQNELSINHIRNNNPGICSNINNAIKICSSKLVKILFSDDLIFDENYIEIVVDSFKNTDKRWLVSSCNHTDGINYYRDFYPRWNENILTNNTYSSPSTITIVKEYFEDFDDNLKMLLDTDFYYRMYHLHGEPIYLNDVKVSNREHNERISSLMQSTSDYQKVLRDEIDYCYRKNQRLYFEYLKNNAKDSEYYLNYKIDRCGPPWFGACISWITAMYSLALINGAKFYLASNDGWRMVSDSESSKNWHGYFESFELSEWKESENDLNTGQYSIRFEDKLFKQLGRLTESGKEDQTIIGSPLTFCPEEFSNPNLTPKQNLSLFKSFCLKEVYKPKKEYVGLSDSLLEGIGEYISVHIRRGDKVKTHLKEGNFIPASTYFESCVSIFEKTGIKNIFVCSDSDEAISEFLECNESSNIGFNIMYDKEESRHDGYPYKILMGELSEDENSKNEMITAFKNIEILSRSDFMVGSPSSWFFRIAQLLRITPENVEGNCINVEEGKETYLPTFYHC